MPRIQRLSSALRTSSRATSRAGLAAKLPSKLVKPASSSLASRLAPVASTSSAVFHRHLASYKPLTSLLSSSPSSSLFPSRLALPSTSVLQQVRTATYGNEYQPSQRVRKRRHGFLARRRSRTGRKVLIRRRMKGRRFLTH